MDDNKKIVSEYIARFNAGDVKGVAELFSNDALVHGVLGWGKVPEITPIWQALADGLAMQLIAEEMIAEGNTVAVRYTETGKSVAPFFGKPATGKSYELVAMEWFTLKEGKIFRRWGTRDAASQARQLEWDFPAKKDDI